MSSAFGHSRPSGKPRNWTRELGRYRDPDTRRSVFEITVTLAGFVLAWVAMAWAHHAGLPWLLALLAVPTGGLLVRLFLIQHDCGHDAFFAKRWENDWVGRVLGVVTLTPYDLWRRAHAIHHATCGNLERRGVGDIDTLTVREYRALSAWRRLKYRAYRHPLVMFGLGPTWVFVLQNRLPVGFMTKGRMPWASTMATNAGIAVLVGGMIWAVGLVPFLVVHLPVVLVAATAGVWLFYVQHQFGATSWDDDRHWTFQDAALNGSSFYDLPRVLRWFTANIGIHHIHHLASRIPYYRLPEVLRDHPDLRTVGHLTIRESLGCVRLALWDEGRRRLVSFREERALPA